MIGEVKPSGRKETNVRSLTNTDETLLISADGYAERCPDLEELRTEARGALAERLREARRDGHLDDNPALYDLFEEQARLERRIALLESQLAIAEIVQPTSSSGRSSRISKTVVCRSTLRSAKRSSGTRPEPRSR